MTKLERLISQCPCDIQMNGPPYEGAAAYMEHPDPKIVVVADMLEYELFAVLSHEIGHVNCFLCHCPCFAAGDNWRIEYHAYRAMLKSCMNYPLALQEAIFRIKCWAARSKNDYPHHRKACRKIIKTRLWRKACKVAINF